jgi:hypothetical protein
MPSRRYLYIQAISNQSASRSSSSIRASLIRVELETTFPGLSIRVEQVADLHQTLGTSLLCRRRVSQSPATSSGLPETERGRLRNPFCRERRRKSVVDFGDWLDIRGPGAGIDQIIHMIRAGLKRWDPKFLGIWGKANGTFESSSAEHLLQWT